MDTYYIYSKLPVFVQNALVSLYSYKIERLRYGDEYESFLSFLKESEFWSLEKIKSYKEEHIFSIIDYAYHNCPFYKKKYDKYGLTPSSFTGIDDIIKFPILTKEEIRENYKEMISLNCRKKDMVPYHTSGSTGKALNFYNTVKNLQAYWAVCSRYRQRFGITKDTEHLNFTGKIVVPLGQSKPPYWRYRKAQHQYMLNMQHISEGKINDIINFIQEHKFKLFVGYPSIMYSFANLASEQGFVYEGGPVYICSSAEKMYDYQREKIQEVFPLAVFVDHYGFSENAGCASMCNDFKYHEDFEFGHLELNNPIDVENGKRGELLSTGFFNYGMPFIRYEIGDTATFSNEICHCGRKSQIISSIDGRNEDYILTPEGTSIMRLDYLFKESKDIKECQIVQREVNTLIFRIVRRSSYLKSTEDDILENVRKYISRSINVEFEYVDYIERTKAGKFKAVVSELSNTNNI